MKVTKLWKWSGSDPGDCPALFELNQAPPQFRGETRAYGVVGLLADQETAAQVEELGEGEVLVTVPSEVIERIVCRLTDAQIAAIRSEWT